MKRWSGSIASASFARRSLPVPGDQPEPGAALRAVHRGERERETGARVARRSGRRSARRSATAGMFPSFRRGSRARRSSLRPSRRRGLPRRSGAGPSAPCPSRTAMARAWRTFATGSGVAGRAARRTEGAGAAGADAAETTRTTSRPRMRRPDEDGTNLHSPPAERVGLWPDAPEAGRCQLGFDGQVRTMSRMSMILREPNSRARRRPHPGASRAILRGRPSQGDPMPPVFDDSAFATPAPLPSGRPPPPRMPAGPASRCTRSTAARTCSRTTSPRRLGAAALGAQTSTPPTSRRSPAPCGCRAPTGCPPCRRNGNAVEPASRRTPRRPPRPSRTPSSRTRSTRARASSSRASRSRTIASTSRTVTARAPPPRRTSMRPRPPRDGRARTRRARCRPASASASSRLTPRHRARARADAGAVRRQRCSHAPAARCRPDSWSPCPR